MAGFYPWVAVWILLGPASDIVPQLTILACSALLTILGLVDDRRHLPASFRLLACALLISLALFIVPSLVLQQISWNYDAGAIGLPVGRFAYSALCIVALIQAANLADGKNGLLIGLSLAWVYFLMVELPTGISPMLLALSGVLFVLLSFNLSGRLFLGDGGSYGLATLIGFMALLAANSPTGDAASDQIALIFLLPVIDMLRLIIVRAARGKSPFAGDRDHLHHHLLAAFGWPGGLVVYLMTATLPSFIAAAAPRHTLSLIAITMAAYFLIIIYARWASRRKHEQTVSAKADEQSA
ncbi:MAG TPA: MraY family glycosyltransferase [Sphingopyxis sp.]|nr:MraY family glycosyltransferase [Sphingopyxis sp.]